MITSSLHNHCSLCDGNDSPEEMLRAAYKAGIKDFGFSSHSYASFDSSASVAGERQYIRAVKDIMASVSLPVNVYLGAEEDVLAPLAFREEYDYVIGAAHYIESGGRFYGVDVSDRITAECVKEVFGGDGMKFAEAYYGRVLAAAERKPDILAHFDLIRKCGAASVDFGSDAYRALAADCLDECLKTGVVFELNYGAVARGRLSSPYPDGFLLRRILEKSGRVAVSTDCHDAEKIAFGLCEGESYLKSLGFKYVTVMRGGRLTEEKL